MEGDSMLLRAVHAPMQRRGRDTSWRRPARCAGAHKSVGSAPRHRRHADGSTRRVNPSRFPRRT